MVLTLNNDLSTLKVGDYFWCKYTATTSGQVGTFSDIATKTDAEAIPVIPVASSATPTGYFKYIVVDFDHLGRVKLLADRNIQHSISWDVLNTKGIASGSGLLNLLPEINIGSNKYIFTTRLLTGGTASADPDNEWDKYIVGSTLGGAITAGDNNVWNWSGIYSWTSTVHTAGSANRTLRGNTAVNTHSYSATNSTYAFRPVLLIESIFTLLNKSFILFSNEYKKWNSGWQTVSPTLPTLIQFQTDGMDNLSTLNRAVTVITLPMDDNTASGAVLGAGKVFKEKVDLAKLFDLKGLNVK